MKYYKNNAGDVYAYESEEERQEWGAPELAEMTQEEVDAHLNPPPGPPIVPQSVSRAQGKAALIQEGLWQGVLDHVVDIEDDTQRAIAEVALHDTQYWRRDSPFLNDAAAAMGVTSEQMDELFIQASEILL